jgi:hypothetical protein
VQLTNRYNLPEVLYQSIASIEHERHGDFSITELQKSPRELQLLHRNDNNIEVDISSRVFTFLGTAVHSFVAQHVSDDYIKEQTFVADVGAYRVFGTPDIVDTGNNLLWDWKLTSTYKANEDNPDWNAQLQGYAWLLRQNEIDIYGGRIIVVMRDWSDGAARNGKGPEIPFKVHEIEMLANEDQDRYIYDKVSMHVDALDLPESELPPCADEQRWKAPDQYKWVADGAARAFKIETSEEALRNYIESAKPRPESYILHIPGEYRYCNRYCLAAPFCSQHQATELEEHVIQL